MKKTLVFDMDGTLLDTIKMWRTYKDLITIDAERIESNEPFKPFEDSVLGYLYTGLYDQLKDFDEGKAYRYLHEFFEDQYGKDDLMKKGVKKKLEKWHSEGHDIYLATATDFHYADIGLKANGIDHYFKKIFTPDTTGHSKHSKEYFEAIIEGTGDKAENIVYFDDSRYATDLANQVGFRSIGVYDEGTREMEENKRIADHFVYDFTQVTDDMVN